MSVATPDATTRLRIAFARMALAAAVLTFVVVVASAFMRHTQAGLSCADWPACYGRIAGSADVDTPSTAVRAARIAHRIAATSVLVLVIGLLLVAWTQKPAWKREGSLAFAAFVVAAALAVLGVVTPGAMLPAVTLGNLLGGYLMLALLSATYAAAAGSGRPAVARSSPAAPLPWIALAVLVIVFAHAALGNLIGAQYALTACPTLGKCPGFPFDEFRLTDAWHPFRPLSIVDGRVVPPAGAAGLYVAHRALGIVVAILVLTLAHGLRRYDRRVSRVLVALALVAPLLGVVAVAAIPSLLFTVLHNAAAAALVATLASLRRGGCRLDSSGPRKADHGHASS